MLKIDGYYDKAYVVCDICKKTAGPKEGRTLIAAWEARRKKFRVVDEGNFTGVWVCSNCWRERENETNFS